MEMACELVTLGTRQVHVWLHTAEGPTAERWEAAIAAIEAQSRLSGSSLPGVVVTDGGAPNAAQRKSLVRLGKPPMSVILPQLANPILRGIATAVRWAVPSIAFYAPSETKEALRAIQLEEHSEAILAALDRLQSTMPKVKTLDLVKAALRAK